MVILTVHVRRHRIKKIYTTVICCSKTKPDADNYISSYDSSLLHNLPY